MTRHRALNWLLAILIAMGMSSVCLLDGPDDITTAQTVADDLADITNPAAKNKNATKTVAAYAHPTKARP